MTSARTDALVIAPASAGPLFTLIPAHDSGLEAVNRYDDPDMWGRRFDEFSGGAVGTGIAVGDFNHDGLPGLYVINKTGPNHLYRQKAPFVFEDVTARAGVGGGAGWNTSATFVDIDGDGWLDLYVCKLNAPNLYYHNNGDGTFTERAAAAGIAVVAGSVSAAFEDYDHDGHLDFFLVTNLGDAARAPNGDRDFLFHNNGDGTFTDVTAAAGLVIAPERGHSATWWDADNDGWPDLYVANDFDAPDHFYHNNRNGTFTDIAATALPHLPWFAMGADFADINNDGNFDLFVADMAGTTHLKRQTFSLGQRDAAALMERTPTPQYAQNALFLNDGKGRFLEIAQLAGVARTDWTWAPIFGDFDNDGWEDLFVTNGMVRDFSNADLIARQGQAASRAQAVGLVKRSPALQEENLMFHNTGHLRFEDVTAAWGLRDVGVSFGAVAADLDRDGDLDLIYANYDGTVSLYRNDSQAHRVAIDLRASGANRFAVGARLFATTATGRQSRRLTLSRGALSSTLAEACFGLGTADHLARLEIDWPDGRVQIAENLAANYRYTFDEPSTPVPSQPPARPLAAATVAPVFSDVTAQTGLGFVVHESPVDEFKDQPLLPMRRQSLGAGIACADVNGDGYADLYFTGGNGQAGILYLNRGDGTFAPDAQTQPWDQPGAGGTMAPLWITAGTSRAPDLVVTNSGIGLPAGDPESADRLYLNDGTGKFHAAAATLWPGVPGPSSVVVAADFKHDGRLGLFVGGTYLPGRYPETSTSRLLENRDGGFYPVAPEFAPALATLGRVTAAIWSDVNNDGWPDLLVATEWGPIRLFLNQQGHGLKEATDAAGLSARTGWWNSIEAADVNNDGNMDYIVGNVGLNTPYQASPAAPARLYYGDFDGSGQNQILEGYYEDGRLLPRRTRDAIVKAMPFLGRTYPTKAKFGAATLGDLFPLDQALALSANEFSSGVLLNDGHGHFEFRALPRLAQVAPIFGLAARDFDGDGVVDLLLVQNFHGPQPGVVRFDGGRGLLLRGRGDGSFEPVPSAESGIDLPGEGRGLAVLDLNRDGWPDAVVTRIDAPAVALANRGKTADKNSCAIVLTGRAGNPHAIGAIVTVFFHDGTQQRIELHAGAGYLSQSEPLAFFGYRDGNRPTRIELRWPDGRMESLPWKRQTRIERVEAP
ncbi:MAG: FG-GAP-like repeat-containing protein [Lacunisphaera sp.]